MSNYPEFSSQSKGYASPPITVILTVTLLLFFFIGFFAIYFCRCFMEDLLNSLHLRRTASGNLVSPTAAAIINTGLEPSIIQAFPTFPYSSVKGFRREKYGLECAICLCEFEDDSILRLLTGCYHVFHQECIDLWLESHKTCPVCRRDLDNLSQKALDKSPMLIHSNSMHDSYNSFEQDNNRSNESLEDAVCISIKEDEITETACVKEEISEEKQDERGHNSNNNNNNCSNTRENEKYEKKGKYVARSNSTGHSVQDDDKHTLRLPEHVKVKIVRGHDWKSCVTFGDFSSHTETCRNNCNGGYHGGEVSRREIN